MTDEDTMLDRVRRYEVYLDRRISRLSRDSTVKGTITRQSLEKVRKRLYNLVPELKTDESETR